MRKTKRLLQLLKRLDEELEKKGEIFLKDRKFLLDINLPAEIRKEKTDDDIEEKITNEFAIEKITEELEKIITL